MKKRWLLIVCVLVVLLAAGNFLYSLLVPASPEEPATRVPEVGLILMENEDGLFVMAVKDDSPASRAGVLAGDQLLSSGETQLTSIMQLEDLLLTADPLPLTLNRQQEQVTLSFKLH